MNDRPGWWDYELVLSPHVIERMQDRGFCELDVRAMLEDASDHRPSVVPGRFVVSSHREGRPWEVVVEPDDERSELVVVTAYEVE